MTVRKWGERPAKIWEGLQTLREGRKGWVGVSQTDLQLMKVLQGCQVVLKPISGGGVTCLPGRTSYMICGAQAETNMQGPLLKSG